MSIEKDLQLNLTLKKDAAKKTAESFGEDIKKLNKALLTDAEINARAEQAIIERTNQAKIKGAVAAKDKITEANKSVAEKAKEAAAAQTANLKELGTMALGSAQKLGVLAIGFVGLGTASAGISAILDHFRAINKAIFEAGEFVQGYRQALLELARLKGAPGSTAEVASQIGFRAQTWQTAAEAKEFQEAAFGAGEASIDEGDVKKLISRSGMETAMKIGGSFQAWEAGSAATHGELIGLMPQILGRRTTGEEVAQKEAQMFKIFQPGRGSFSSIVQQYSKSVIPYLGVKAIDPMVGAAILSAQTLSAGAGAGEQFTQFMRATVGGIDKSRKGGITGAIPQGEYYRRDLKITDELLKATKSEDLPLLIAGRVAEDLKQQKIDASAKGDQEHALVYLRQKGFSNVEDTKAMLNVVGLMQTRTLQDTFLKRATDEAMPTLAQATEPVEEARRTDLRMMRKQADIAKDIAKIQVGMGMPEFINTIQEFAFSRLKDPNRPGGALVSGDYSEDIKNRWSIDPREIISLDRRQTEIESQKIVFEQARKLKIPIPAADRSLRGNLAHLGGITGEQTYIGDEALYALQAKIQAAGGSLLPSLEPMAAAAQKTAEQTQAFETGKGFPGLGGVMPAAGADPAGVKLHPETVKALTNLGPVVQPPLDAPRVQNR